MSVFADCAERWSGTPHTFEQKGYNQHVFMHGGGCAGFTTVWLRLLSQGHTIDALKIGTERVFDDAQWIMQAGTKLSPRSSPALKRQWSGHAEEDRGKRIRLYMAQHALYRSCKDSRFDKLNLVEIARTVAQQRGYYYLALSNLDMDNLEAMEELLAHAVGFVLTAELLAFFDPNCGSVTWGVAEIEKFQNFMVDFGGTAYSGWLDGEGYLARFHRHLWRDDKPVIF